MTHKENEAQPMPNTTHEASEPEVVDRELSLEDIVEADDIADGIEKFPTPEWRGHIYLRPLSAADVIAFNREMKMKAREDAMLVLFAKAACDSRGVLLIKNKMTDLGALGRKSTAPFVRAQTRIMQMSGMLTQSKTFEELQPLLEKHGVDPVIIRRIQTEWTEGDPAGKP